MHWVTTQEATNDNSMTKRGVSKLAFYAQSNSAVISGQSKTGCRWKNENKNKFKTR